MEKLLGRLIENTPLALVVIGLFLFVIGAAGGWERFSLQITESGWRITLATMGFILVAYACLLIWRPKSATQIVAEPEREALKKACNLTIQTWTAIDRGRPNQYELTGEYKQLPPAGNSVWLITASTTSPRYWPQNEVVFDNAKMKWNSIVGLGAATRSGEKMRVILAIIGDCGNILFSHYFGTRDKENPNAVLPLSKLTHDIIECASVVLDKRQSSSAQTK